MMLYYWLRLFPELAFYVEMIAETLKDIRHFLVIFVMCIAVFANAFFTLNGIVIDSSTDSTTVAISDLANNSTRLL
jgi:hypothetical protein